MARKIWCQSGKPSKWVSDQLRIERWQLRAAIHKIKARNGLSSTDYVEIWDDGAVTDSSGDFIGDVYDEI
jgi:hypothetical protein